MLLIQIKIKINLVRNLHANFCINFLCAINMIKELLLLGQWQPLIRYILHFVLQCM